MSDLKKAWTYMWFGCLYPFLKLLRWIYDDEFHKMVDTISNTRIPTKAVKGK